MNDPNGGLNRLGRTEVAHSPIELEQRIIDAVREFYEAEAWTGRYPSAAAWWADRIAPLSPTPPGKKNGGLFTVSTTRDGE